MLNFILNGPVVDLALGDPGSDALVEIGEGADLSDGQGLGVSVATLTEADMSTEKDSRP